MAKLTLNTIGSRYGSIDALNDNFNAIETAIENTFSLDGTSPNALEADLDMNSNDILNAGEVSTDTLRINGVLVEPSTGVTAGAVFQTYEFTATAGQTSFSVSPATPYNASIVVIVNGLQLSPAEVSVSGTNVIIPALTLGDEVVIRRYTAEPVASPDASEVNFIQAGTGAVTRTSQNKMRDIVSVKDFGAVGDGVADDTAAMQAAHTFASGRPVYYPKGVYKFSSISLTTSGDGIVGDHSGGTAGLDGTLLVSTVSGTTGAIQLATSTAQNVLLKDFTLKQNSGTIQGRGITAADCYWLRTDNLRITGFTDNLYCSLSIYHHHQRLFSENSTNGVNYWGASGTWNTAWFNNVITFDTCRFSACTVTGASIKGCEVVFINPDFSGMSAIGAIGLKVYGESAGFQAHGIKIISPYIEDTKIGLSFTNSKVEIDGGGYIQGGTSVGTQAKSIIDANASQVLFSGVEDKDYFEFGYRLTNGSTLRMRQLFGGSIRATAGTADATSTFLPDTYSAGTFTMSFTGCTAAVTGTATWEKRGNTVTLLIPALGGTSNATTATLTGMPAAIQPLTEQFALANVINNGVEVIGAVRLFTSGTISLSSGIFGTAFTNTGSKSVRAMSLVYSAG